MLDINGFERRYRKIRGFFERQIKRAGADLSWREAGRLWLREQSVRTALGKPKLHFAYRDPRLVQDARVWRWVDDPAVMPPPTISSPQQLSLWGNQ